MCKKVFETVLIFLLLFNTELSSFAGSSGLSVSAEAAILMISGSNEIIFSENSNLKLAMASTTKIMTAVLAIENGDLSREITVTDKMVRVEGTSSGLLPGDKIDLITLLYCMMLQSGNDAANVTAYAVSGSVEKFVSLMNKKAEEIGMENTHFATVSGLDAEDHYSTAYDMAVLASYAIENPVFKEICSTYKTTVEYGNPKYNRTITNHNKLLNSYEGLIGVKTGFTKKSGRCLVTAAERNGLTLICVTLNDWNDWDDHKKMLDYGFRNVKKNNVSVEDLPSVPVVGSEHKCIKTALPYIPSFFSFKKGADISYKIFIEPFLYAPINKNDIVGTVCFYNNGKCVAEVPVLAAENASYVNQKVKPSDEGFSLKRILQFFKERKNAG